MANAPAYISIAAAAIAALSIIIFAAPLTVAAARASGTGDVSQLRLRSDGWSLCGVTGTEVADAFDNFNKDFCNDADLDLPSCCLKFVDDIKYFDEAADERGEPQTGWLPNFSLGCREDVSEVGVDGLCKLVLDDPTTYDVLQPLLDRCENLRKPCPQVEPPKPCDTPVAVVSAAAKVAYTSWRLCGGHEFCCWDAVSKLMDAVSCGDICWIYRASKEAKNFLTVCEDVSSC